MNKTPSALKWLAEKRARVAHDVDRTGRLVRALSERLSRSQANLQALDDTLRLYDEATDPSEIAPVNGWAQKYGLRGAFQKALLKLLEEHSPEWVSTENLECMLLTEFGISFPAPSARRLWRRNTLLSALRGFCRAGVAERVDAASAEYHAPKLWRAKQGGLTTLANL